MEPLLTLTKLHQYPRAHIETIYDLSDDQAAFIFQAAVKISRAVREAAGCEGLNMVQSNSRAGQLVCYSPRRPIKPCS
jgi:diadenosine tetraphosphate (Ap4A) HIT family hydrolase